MELTGMIPALRKQDQPDSDLPPIRNRGPHPEFVSDLPEGQTAALRDVRRWQRVERRHEKARRRKGQRAYNRALRAERIRQNTVQAQINVLQGPDTAMRRNVIAALERKYADVDVDAVARNLHDHPEA